MWVALCLMRLSRIRVTSSIFGYLLASLSPHFVLIRFAQFVGGRRRIAFSFVSLSTTSRCWTH